MDIKIDTDLKALQRKLNVLKDKTFLKVMKEGINQTAAYTVNAHRQTLLKKLKSPKKSTLTSIKMSQFARATMGGLKATVSVAKGSTNALYYMYTGDDEPARREMYPSPTRDGLPKANKFGNIVTQSGIIKKIANNKSSNKKGSVFFGVPSGAGSKKYGVWQRTGAKGKEGLELLVAFTPFIKHKKLVDWFALSHKAVKNNLYKEINKELRRRVKRAMK
tara:strand:- start:47 stop:703 length:657 start_codon:yes stop_codon:yes gene_type:complete